MREHEQGQMTRLVWAVRAAVALVLALAASAGPSKANAGVGFEYAKSSSKVAYRGAGLSFHFKLKGSGTRDLAVEVVRPGAGIVSSIPVDGLPTSAPLGVDWNGLNANGKPAKTGKYVFKVRNARNGKITRMKKVSGKRVFKLRSASFPVRGPHTFGDGWGAGRGHQGQDIFASCGTPLVSPQRGRVVARAFQGSAGHYVVVTLSGSGQDAVFMHLAKASWAKKGTNLFAGQQIGKVGQTGNAQGCHLHFEMWTAPGWYNGGAPYDPLPTLRAWGG